jgi:hypothetical protein
MKRKRRIAFDEAYYSCDRYLSPLERKTIDDQVNQLSPGDRQKLDGFLSKARVWKRAFEITVTPLSVDQSRFALRPGLIQLLDVQCFQFAHSNFLTTEGQNFVASWMGLMLDPAATSQAIRNIRLHEQRLLGVAWWDLFLCFRELQLLKNPSPTLAKVFKSYILHGPKTQIGDVVMGRLVRYEDFREMLRELHLECGSGETLDDKIESLCLKYPGKSWLLPECFRALHLHKWAMWATFSRSLDETDPFGGLRGKRARHIACLLGLDPKPKPSGGWLRMRYRLPQGVSPYFPTVADAYATGFATSYQFLPARTGAPYGETLPCPERRNCSGLPECIHEPVPADCLIGPMERLS